MYFIGIDQSIANTGWCVLAEDHCVSVGKIIPKKLTGPRRLLYIHDALADLASGFHLRAGAVESGSYNSSGRIFQLGGVHALVQVVLWQSGADVIDVAPAQLKKFMTGKSGAKKEWMVEAARRVTGLESIDDNVADAVGLACISRAVCTGKVRTRAEAETVHKLQKAGAIHCHER